MPWDDGLTEEQKADVLATYDASERDRVRREWEADGSYEHDCDPLDTYAGGCAVCGAIIDTTPTEPCSNCRVVASLVFPPGAFVAGDPDCPACGGSHVVPR